MLTAIIVAGGSSRRMGFDKTFALLGDRPIVAHAIAAFEATGSVEHIIVVGRLDRVAELHELIARQQFKKVRDVIPGGIRRQDSVGEGLRSMPPTDYVAVHDAARPLVLPSQIEQVFAAARTHGAAALAAPVTDTLKRADAEGIVSGSVDRDGLYAMQTPQIFSRELLLAACAHIAQEKLSITDEVSAIERLGQNVALVTNNDPNFKITFPGDLALAELVLKLRLSPDR
ncbi:MAG TPA: 2-C-methyl-D-erythritol 4-phosphate cytidylyltransferase [Chthoniobacterales bacterium]|nr:2-C-methyl-D-erythritol 4-phosphate cytidylyltransferase [Chthoniobacterales bacterium]